MFLFLFATTKVLQATLALPSLPPEVELPELAFNLISGCSYITLLLFLEMHWRQILKPLSAMRSKRKTWSLFWALNVLLYVVVFAAAFAEARGAGRRGGRVAGGASDLLVPRRAARCEARRHLPLLV